MRNLLLLLCLTGLAGCGGAPAVKSPEDALAAIKASGGRVTNSPTDKSAVIEISLNKSEIGNDGPACAGAFPELERLWLKKSGVTDSGLPNVAGLSNLKKLGLDDNEVSDTGLEHLAKLSNLEVLLLSATKVTGPGLDHLKGLSSLNTLDLSRTQIDDAGLEPLKAMTSLRSLTLVGTKVTLAAVKELHQAIPNCRIAADGITLQGLPGYYEVQSTTIDGQPDAGTVGSILVLRPDGTFTIVRKVKVGEQPKGTWSVGGGKLTMNHSSGTTISAEMQLEESKLTLSYTDAGSKFVSVHEEKQLSREPTESLF